jgi:hypothetical protein
MQMGWLQRLRGPRSTMRGQMDREWEQQCKQDRQTDRGGGGIQIAVLQRPGARYGGIHVTCTRLDNDQIWTCLRLFCRRTHILRCGERVLEPEERLLLGSSDTWCNSSVFGSAQIFGQPGTKTTQSQFVAFAVGEIHCLRQTTAAAD